MRSAEALAWQHDGRKHRQQQTRAGRVYHWRTRFPTEQNNFFLKKVEILQRSVDYRQNNEDGNDRSLPVADNYRASVVGIGCRW